MRTQTVSSVFLTNIFLCCCCIVFILLVNGNDDGVNVGESNSNAESSFSDIKSSYNHEKNEETSVGDNVFKPSNEWQTVPKGQAIPPGLHVRMNLETGQTEAKLLDSNDQSKSQNSVIASDNKADVYSVPKSSENNKDQSRLQRVKETLEQAIREIELGNQEDPMQGSESLQAWEDGIKEGMMNKKHAHFSREELQEALKNFKADDSSIPENEAGGEMSASKFRSIEEIQRDFAQLNVDFKTDMEILTNLMSRYKQHDLSIDDKLNVLNDLEYLLHQVDNAINFIDVNGLDLLVKDFNHTDESVRSESIKVFTSAVQGNPKVQIKCLDAGILPILVRMLAVESSRPVRARLLSACSAFIRQFPYAQEKFITLGGLQTLVDVFSNKYTNDKLRLKIVTLLHDLLAERSSTATDPHLSTNSVLQTRLMQYERMPLLPLIVEQGWCDRISLLIDLSDHDAREKVLKAMLEVKDACRQQFLVLVDKLAQLENEYRLLAVEETDSTDDYFTLILQLIHAMQNFLINNNAKEEL